MHTLRMQVREKNRTDLRSSFLTGSFEARFSDSPVFAQELHRPKHESLEDQSGQAVSI